MKRKFSLPANLELKFCWKIYTKITKVILEAFLGDFLLKISIIWYKDMRKDIPFYNYEGPPLASPTTQHPRIMEYMRFYENAWLGFRYYTFLQTQNISFLMSLYQIIPIFNKKSPRKASKMTCLRFSAHPFIHKNCSPL